MDTVCRELFDRTWFGVHELGQGPDVYRDSASGTFLDCVFVIEFAGLLHISGADSVQPRKVRWHSSVHTGVVVGPIRVFVEIQNPRKVPNERLGRGEYWLRVFGPFCRRKKMFNRDERRKSLKEEMPWPACPLDGVQVAGVQRQIARVCKQASAGRPPPSLSPKGPLRLCAIDAVHGSHLSRVGCPNEKLPLLAAGRGHGMTDSQDPVALYALGLYAHLQGAFAADDVPRPVCADPGFLVF